MLWRAELRLPAACVNRRVPAVLTRLNLVCCEGVTPELGLRAMLTFRKSLCLLVLRKLHHSFPKPGSQFEKGGGNSSEGGR